jgi:hypothetical protein
MQTFLSSPGLEALWQMHWSYNAMLEQNSPGMYIANIEDMPTIAGVLTAPPRGGGPGGAPAATAPAGAAPGAAVPPAPAAAPAATPPAPGTPPAGQPPAGAPGAGRGRGNQTGHTPAYWLKVSAHPDGSFTITNPRNGFSKTYAPRTPPRPTK